MIEQVFMVDAGWFHSRNVHAESTKWQRASRANHSRRSQVFEVSRRCASFHGRAAAPVSMTPGWLSKPLGHPLPYTFEGTHVGTGCLCARSCGTAIPIHAGRRIACCPRLQLSCAAPPSVLLVKPAAGDTAAVSVPYTQSAAGHTCSLLPAARTTGCTVGGHAAGVTWCMRPWSRHW
jgi:hypothetical protein